MDPGCPEEVQGYVGLRDKQIPTVVREFGVGAAEHSNEMVLEPFDGSLSWIGPVVSW